MMAIGRLNEFNFSPNSLALSGKMFARASGVKRLGVGYASGKL
jgi:hypothetical protein